VPFASSVATELPAASITPTPLTLRNQGTVLDRRENRIEHFRHDQAEDVEDRIFSLVLPGPDAEHSLA
jgi:hypothetical protein